MNGPHARNKKKLFPPNLKFFSLRPGYTKKYFFPLILAIILFIGLFVSYQLVRSNVTAPSAGALTSSFSFTAGGDIGGNSNSSTALDLIAQSGSQFDLALGDLSYSERTPESAWCSYVQSHVGSTFPFELLSGNHEDGGEGNKPDGLIDTFTQCLPDRLGAVGTYGKEYYFDYPASSPIARFIMISPDLTFTNGGLYSYAAGTDHYNWLVSKKVDLILQGHDHDYQRSKQLALNGTTCTAIQAETYNSNCVVNDGSTGSYTQGSGPLVVIVGTVGEGLHTISLCDGDTGYFAKWMGNN